MSESKEAMQNTIKNLQAKSEYINKLEDKGNRALVLQLGSHSIKMGFANEKAPFILRPFIAYKRKLISANNSSNLHPHRHPTSYPPSTETFDYEYFKTEYQKLEERLRIEGIVSPDNRTLKGKPRAKQTVIIDRFNDFDGETLKVDADTLYGEDALWAESNPEEYIFRKPLEYGFLNSTNVMPNNHEQQHDFSQSINDITNLITYLLTDKLKIPRPEWRSFSCVIVLPDIFIRKHVKSLIQNIFRYHEFNKVYLHLESVLACFGTSVSSACVVDIGHEKISVCCVDEGVIVPHTLIRKNFGLKFMSKGLCKIFAERITDKEIGELKVSSEADLNQIDKVKEISTAIRDPDETINRVYEINVIRKRSLATNQTGHSQMTNFQHLQQIPFQVSYSDSICVISNSIFSELWNSFEENESVYMKKHLNLHSEAFDLYEDSEDYLEEFSGGGHMHEINRFNNSQQIDEQFFDPWSYQPLEDLVDACLSSIKDNDQKKKYLTNILVIGGGGHLSRLTEELIAKLKRKYGYLQEQLQQQQQELLKEDKKEKMIKEIVGDKDKKNNKIKEENSEEDDNDEDDDGNGNDNINPPSSNLNHNVNTSTNPNPTTASTFSPEKIDVACDMSLREILPIHASWLGGTIIPKLDSLRDLWIERSKFLGESELLLLVGSGEGSGEGAGGGNNAATAVGGNTKNNAAIEEEPPVAPTSATNTQLLNQKLFTRKEQSEQWGITYLKEKVPFVW